MPFPSSDLYVTGRVAITPPSRPPGSTHGRAKTAPPCTILSTFRFTLRLESPTSRATNASGFRGLRQSAFKTRQSESEKRILDSGKGTRPIPTVSACASLRIRSTCLKTEFSSAYRRTTARNGPRKLAMMTGPSRSSISWIKSSFATRGATSTHTLTSPPPLKRGFRMTSHRRTIPALRSFLTRFRTVPSSIDNVRASLA